MATKTISDQKVVKYIQTYQKKGFSPADIREALTKSGVTGEQIARCMKQAKGSQGLSTPSKIGIAVAGIILILLGALALISVIPESLECTSDRDCGSGFECVSNQCVVETPVAECVRDLDCGINEQCIGGSCIFVPPTVQPECVSDNDCPLGDECIGGECVLRAECTNDFECQEGFECKAGECRLKAADYNFDPGSILVEEITNDSATFSYVLDYSIKEDLDVEVECRISNEDLGDNIDTDTETLELDKDDNEINGECTLDISEIYDAVVDTGNVDVRLIVESDPDNDYEETDENDNEATYREDWDISLFTAAPLECTTDTDCGTLEICGTDNTCVAVGCVTDADCKEGEQCNAANECEVIPGIVDVCKEDCSPYACNVVEEVCHTQCDVSRGILCDESAACLGTECFTCIDGDNGINLNVASRTEGIDLVSGTKVSKADSCVTGAFREVLEYSCSVVNGQSFVSVSSQTCEEGSSCVDGACVRDECAQDADCGKGYQCNLGARECISRQCNNGVDEDGNDLYDALGACQAGSFQFDDYLTQLERTLPEQDVRTKVSYREGIENGGVFNCDIFPDLTSPTAVDCQAKCVGNGGVYLLPDFACQDIEDNDETTPECATNAHCSGTTICEAGSCVAVECTQDNDCDTGYQCDRINNVCEVTQCNDGIDNDGDEFFDAQGQILLFNTYEEYGNYLTDSGIQDYTSNSPEAWAFFTELFLSSVDNIDTHTIRYCDGSSSLSDCSVEQLCFVYNEVQFQEHGQARGPRCFYAARDPQCTTFDTKNELGLVAQQIPQDVLIERLKNVTLSLQPISLAPAEERTFFEKVLDFLFFVPFERLGLE